MLHFVCKFRASRTQWAATPTLPRKTDLTTVSEYQFHQLMQAYTNALRKCLGYSTPAEIF